MRLSPWPPRFGLLYAVILLLITIPGVILFTLAFEIWPWSKTVGFEIRTSNSATLFGDPREGPVVVTVERTEREAWPRGVEARLLLNSESVTWNELRDALRRQLSRRSTPVVFVDGSANLSFGDIVRVIDIARDAWYGVPVVLLTPTLKRKFHVEQQSAASHHQRR